MFLRQHSPLFLIPRLSYERWTLYRLSFHQKRHRSVALGHDGAVPDSDPYSPPPSPSSQLQLDGLSRGQDAPRPLTAPSVPTATPSAPLALVPVPASSVPLVAPRIQVMPRRQVLLALLAAAIIGGVDRKS